MNDLRIKVTVYDKETDEKVDGFDTYIEESRSFEMTEIELGSLIRRIVMKKHE